MPALDYSLIADIYDSFVQSDQDISFFQESVRGVSGRVLELMCGTGRVSLPLLASGASLTCVDHSPEMLSVLREKLRQRGASAELVEEDVRCLSLPGKYELALIPFNSFSEITRESEQLAALSSIRRCLTGNGRLIVTLQNPIVRLDRVDGFTHTLGRFPFGDRGESIAVRTNEQYDPIAKLVEGEEVFEAISRTGKVLWTRRISIAFRLFTREEFHDLATRGGFKVEGLFGDYDHSPFNETASPSMIWNLRARAG
jgi:SAM-dependent methyltransferase